MKSHKATIVYQSKRGMTQKYASEIAFFLKKKGIEPTVVSIKKFNKMQLETIDFLFLGCWTSGWFFILQSPVKEWVDFAKSLPENIKTKTALFTTYKVRTGSMFSNMSKYLRGKTDQISLNLKSRNGELSETDKIKIDNFLNISNL